MAIDHRARGREDLALIFEHFGEEECPQLGGELYRALCRGIRGDAALLAMAAQAPPEQPPPNLLFAAVQDLLLAGTEHPLRAWYPTLGGKRAPDEAFAVFRAFCLEHRAAIERRLATRLTQTNVIQRTSALLPAFGRVHARTPGRPLALIEIGPSAGLNLNWDRFRYAYDTGLRWGDPGSRVLVPCELRGATPQLPREIPVAWRRGVDLRPVDLSDPDAVRWLRALIWPEHTEREARLAAAIELARRHPPELLEGDAAEVLPALLAAAPCEATLCVYGTHTLYQFPRDALLATFRAMQHASQDREIAFVSMEGTGDRCSELTLTRYREGERERQLLARCSPHGRWLDWLSQPVLLASRVRTASNPQ